MRNTENRSIILCHDGHSGTYDANFEIISALDRAILELQQNGFNFVTVDNLLETGNYEFMIERRIEREIFSYILLNKWFSKFSGELEFFPVLSNP